jgi:hypothetical protein
METVTIEAQQSFSSRKLPIQHIGAIAESAFEIINNRRTGVEKSLDTGFNSLNKALLNGAE